MLGQAPSQDNPLSPTGLEVETMTERQAVASDSPEQNGTMGYREASQGLKRALDLACCVALGKRLKLSESLFFIHRRRNITGLLPGLCQVFQVPCPDHCTGPGHRGGSRDRLC